MPEGTETTTQTQEGTQADQGQQQETQQQETQDLATLPEWARASLKKANDEAARYRTQVRELQPKAEAQKTEQQKSAEARQVAEDRAVKAESEAARLRIALTKSLPVELASRLVGNTEEELTADADRLLELVQAAPTRTPSFDGGARTSSDEPDMNAAIRRAAGR